MTLVSNTYGKGRVRVMRVRRDGERHEVRELSVQAMLDGDFGRAYTHGDNAAVVATDTIKTIVNLVAREEVATETEPFLRAVAGRFLDRYPQVEAARVSARETRWVRLTVDGHPHPHGFALDGNGAPTAAVTATRGGVETTSGVAGLTVLKSTGSGWSGFLRDEVTTLPETRDRLCATSLDASWRWAGTPADFRAANAAVVRRLLEVFVSTYSEGVQDSLYRMGLAALDAAPEIADIRLAAPNKHYLPINFAPFGLEPTDAVLLPTDEPHGQIECTVARD